MNKRLFQTLAPLLAIVLVCAPVSASPGTPDGRAALAAPDALAQAQAPARKAPARKAPARKIALGVSMLPATIDSYTAFKATMGRAPATWSIWTDWAGGANPSAFPTTLVKQLHHAGTVPFIFWQPVGPGTPPGNPGGAPLQASCGTDYTKIIKGDWDLYIHQYAKAAKAAGGRILIRFAHEMDGNWFPFGYTRCTNTAAKFRAMWRHVVGIFRHDRATNVKFVWSPVKASADRKPLYPGNKWVDYVAFTTFNWSTFKGAPWTSFLTGVQRATAGLKSYAKSKPWIVAETGSPAEPGSRPAWLTKGFKQVYNKVRNVALIIYFNVDMQPIAGQPDWQLTSHADIHAYRSLLSRAHFRGKIR